ncbi:hypothetical protein MesoLjLc_37810 [Mesorhizobium sp. L-8-10]|uniref:hypothetical protein n=1 Tax=Mesorhizobium sp. L-8-10 TaxID=2744523 RepID=UPI00192665F7|nr:hypothetical protein [Mesorhizobium sp. L-8-10]BCH31851.1 hypothetical protein MesoLjLc_37810 [Mesorhizobium sp. L-8-10]
MHVRSDETKKSRPAFNGSWRVAVDRAWRSPSFRRRFEIECGLSPIDETKDEQIDSGEVAAYYNQFVAWATLTLGLTDQVPPFAQRGYD